MSGQRITGLILILVGGALLLVTLTDLDGSILLPLIGVAFLVAYAVNRAYGMLVPGAIITGLGVGVVLEAQGLEGSWPVLGLGVGFLVIALVDRLSGGIGSGWWWPFIPGGVLTVVGLSSLPGGAQVLNLAVPGALILFGLALVFGRRPRRDRHAHGQDREASNEPQ